MVESFEWWLTYESSVVIVCSDSMKSDARMRYSVPEDKIFVIPIGVDPSKFEKSSLNREMIRERLGVGGWKKFALFVGRLTHQKGCEYLIKAIPFVARYYDVKLVIVGDGYMRGDLEQVAKSTGESWRIQFTGFLPDSEVVDLMLSADVMVVPSVYEPFGVVALEAMAAKTPIVASQVDGLAEIVTHEKTGILVYPRDSSSIAWGISRIFSDPVNTKRLVDEAAEELSSRFTWDAVAIRTLECYKKALL
jgi:glycogen synthase